MWNWSARLTARCTALAAAMLLSGAVAHACENAPVAGGAASFTSCDTPWKLIQSNAQEEIYFCDAEGCPEETILRFSLEEMAESDRALERDALLVDWTRRQLPDAMEGYAIEPLEPINVRTLNQLTGVLIAMRLTETATDAAYVSLAFRIPRKTDYVVPNITGRGELSELYPLLAGALNGITLQRELPQ